MSVSKRDEPTWKLKKKRRYTKSKQVHKFKYLANGLIDKGNYDIEIRRIANLNPKSAVY